MTSETTVPASSSPCVQIKGKGGVVQMSTSPYLRQARGGVAVVVPVLLSALALLVPVSQALAKEPTGYYARFSQCPRFATGVNLCFAADIYGGAVTLNKQTVPINADGEHEIVIEGGIIQEEHSPFNESVVGALNGETVSRTPQTVPGGLAGMMGCTELQKGGWSAILTRAACKLISARGVNGLNAITELARPANEVQFSKEHLFAEETGGLTLPVKIRLENPLLGDKCYIGSSAHPIMLALTGGTTSPNPPNVPISGSLGEAFAFDEFNFVELRKNTFVNNEFEVPQASGCGGVLSFLIDPLIDSKIGLPSPDGHNAIIAEANLYEGTTVGVIASER